MTHTSPRIESQMTNSRSQEIETAVAMADALIARYDSAPLGNPEHATDVYCGRRVRWTLREARTLRIIARQLVTKHSLRGGHVIRDTALDRIDAPVVVYPDFRGALCAARELIVAGNL